MRLWAQIVERQIARLPGDTLPSLIHFLFPLTVPPTPGACQAIGFGAVCRAPARDARKAHARCRPCGVSEGCSPSETSSNTSGAPTARTGPKRSWCWRRIQAVELSVDLRRHQGRVSLAKVITGASGSPGQALRASPSQWFQAGRLPKPKGCIGEEVGAPATARLGVEAARHREERSVCASTKSPRRRPAGRDQPFEHQPFANLAARHGSLPAPPALQTSPPRSAGVAVGI